MGQGRAGEGVQGGDGGKPWREAAGQGQGEGTRVPAVLLCCPWTSCSHPCEHATGGGTTTACCPARALCSTIGGRQHPSHTYPAHQEAIQWVLLQWLVLRKHTEQPVAGLVHQRLLRGGTRRSRQEGRSAGGGGGEAQRSGLSGRVCHAAAPPGACPPWLACFWTYQRWAMYLPEGNEAGKVRGMRLGTVPRQWACGSRHGGGTPQQAEQRLAARGRAH